VDELTQFRATWTDSPISKYKKQERLKAFFKFCVKRQWISENPVEGLKPVKVVQVPTLPFGEDEMDRILQACDRYPLQGIYNSGNRTRRAHLLLRYSGLRIRDGVCLKREHLREGKIFYLHAEDGNTGLGSSAGERDRRA
jgi:site-specific recombinase XerD